MIRLRIELRLFGDLVCLDEGLGLSEDWGLGVDWTLGEDWGLVSDDLRLFDMLDIRED